jgi:hypothetical protein
MSLYTMLRAVLGEAAHREFPAMISAECSNLPSRLSFSSCLECSEHGEIFILCGQQHEPHD